MLKFQNSILVVFGLAGTLLQIGVARAQTQSKGSVLVVLSGKDYVTTKEGNRHPTGYFLSELADTSLALVKAGYTLTFATPGGAVPTMDQVSNDAKWFKSEKAFDEAKSFVASNQKLSRPLMLERLTEHDLASFSGVLVPGGHAPLEDLSRSRAMGRVLGHFHDHRKPTALVCHGPAALLSAVQRNRWIYSGYKMTTFSTSEEKQEEDAGHLDGHMRIYLDAALQKMGARVEVAAPWHSQAVRDRELITGQNPMSGEAFANLFIDALAEQRKSRSFD